MSEISICWQLLAAASTPEMRQLLAASDAQDLADRIVNIAQELGLHAADPMLLLVRRLPGDIHQESAD